MSQAKIAIVGLAIGTAIYMPIGMYAFDLSLSEMLSRAYFTLGGAAIALFATR